MHFAYLLLGSNSGNSREMMQRAEVAVASEIGEITARSPLYKTAAWGNRDQPDFLNRVLLAKTSVGAEVLLRQILNIEKKLGRVRTFKNAPRTIDIDILFFDNDIISTPALTVPHAEIQNRRFVLEPLACLAPDYIHPLLGKTSLQLLAQCRDTLNVQKI